MMYLTKLLITDIDHNTIISIILFGFFSKLQPNNSIYPPPVPLNLLQWWPLKMHCDYKSSKMMVMFRPPTIATSKASLCNVLRRVGLSWLASWKKSSTVEECNGIRKFLPESRLGFSKIKTARWCNQNFSHNRVLCVHPIISHLTFSF